MSGAAESNGIWVADLAGGPHRQLTTGASDREPMFSHDGATVYLLRGDGDLQQVYRVPVAGGEATPVSPTGAIGFGVSPTADLLVYIVGPPNVGRLHRGPDAGPFTPIDTLPPARYSQVKFSPAGDRFLVRREPTEIIEMTATGTRPRVVRSAPDVLEDVIYAPGGDGFLGTIQVQTGDLFVLDGRFP
jgi:dipeptidyl aminopeptidase/acylaminoacyl peptidase